jgi:hypothetical protein
MKEGDCYYYYPRLVATPDRVQGGIIFPYVAHKRNLGKTVRLTERAADGFFLAADHEKSPCFLVSQTRVFLLGVCVCSLHQLRSILSGAKQSVFSRPSCVRRARAPRKCRCKFLLLLFLGVETNI